MMKFFLLYVTQSQFKLFPFCPQSEAMFVPAFSPEITEIFCALLE